LTSLSGPVAHTMFVCRSGCGRSPGLLVGDHFFLKNK
jgi:hypothetical protein